MTFHSLIVSPPSVRQTKPSDPFRPALTRMSLSWRHAAETLGADEHNKCHRQAALRPAASRYIHVGSSIMKTSTRRDYVNVCASFKPMRDPLSLILAALHNSKTELTANCVHTVAVAHDVAKGDTSVPLSVWWDPLLSPCIRISESDFQFYNLSRHCYNCFKSHFFFIPLHDVFQVH